VIVTASVHVKTLILTAVVAHQAVDAQRTFPSRTMANASPKRSVKVCHTSWHFAANVVLYALTSKIKK